MNLNNYEDYISDIILENIKNDEMILILSDELKMILNSINHPISKRILGEGNFYEHKFKITLLDVDDSDENKKDNISFSLSNKTIEKIISHFNIGINPKEEMLPSNVNELTRLLVNNKDFLFKYNRSTTSIGKIVNKLYPNEYKVSGDPGNDIESFVNLYKSIRNIENNFELVKGDDIVYWYNGNNYSELQQGTLHSSCMRYDRCDQYIEFYAVNPDKVSMLILKDTNDNTKIKGRALVWNLDEPSGRTFMDRIYTIHDYDIQTFKEYAKKHEWLYKKEQNMSEGEYLVDTMYDDNIDTRTLIINDMKNSEYEKYPYTDTFKYYDNSTLSNDESEIDDSEYKKLESTSGGFDSHGTWSDYYDEYIDTENGDYYWCEDVDDYRTSDDSFYSYEYNRQIANDYAENNGVYCDNYDGYDNWRENGDYVESSEGNTATEEWASENWYYSDYSNEWVEEANYSNYHETYINSNDSIEVYTDAQKDGIDYRSEGDDTYWKWDYDDEYYDENVTLDELKEENGLNKKREMIKHKRKYTRERRVKNNIETND